jgi:hypothetical protein
VRCAAVCDMCVAAVEAASLAVADEFEFVSIVHLTLEIRKGSQLPYMASADSAAFVKPSKRR